MEFSYIIIFALGFVFAWVLLKPKIKERTKLDEENKSLNEQLKIDNSSLVTKRDMLINQKDFLVKSIEELENNYKIGCQNNDERLQEHFKYYKNELQNEYNELVEEYRQAYLDTMKEHAEEFNALGVEQKEELASLTASLKRLRSITNAAIEENKRARLEKEQKDFYRIMISELDVQEIKKIREIEPYLRDTAPLNKVIWKSYYETPFNEMIGRVIGADDKTGIYKLTNLLNGMIYIGQAAHISTRWREHVKRGVGADTPNRNKLYPAMLKDGVENFTFEFLEECAPDVLDDRERFWIDYFQAKANGYNSTVGNKEKLDD